MTTKPAPETTKTPVKNSKNTQHVLETEKDYENTPSGTVVAGNTYVPYVKYARNTWLSAIGDETHTDLDMAKDSRIVLREGWTV